MDIYLQLLSNKLKQEVLDVANIQRMVSSDCYRLARDIAAKTDKAISTTTLKRLYGYAQSRFMLSQFTLNVLAEYCGYESWPHYVHQTELDSNGRSYWKELKSFCHETTRNSLDINKRNSGIPFSLTAQRVSVEQHLTEFVESSTTITFLCAHKGMGKTIALTHWIDGKLMENNKKVNDDIFMYISSASLYANTKFTNSWRLWLADILHLHSPNSLNRFFQEFNLGSRGNFFLIIEDLNNIGMLKKRFNLLFKQIVDMVRQLKQHRWIKLIITVLPSTWRQYGHYIENLHVGKSRWYSVFCLPEFNLKELEILAMSINGHKLKLNTVYLKRFSFITLPAYMECFYKMKNKRVPLTELCYGDLYTIILFYLRKYILKSKAIEYQCFIFQIINYVRFFDGLAFVNKRDIISILRSNYGVYHELILKEVMYEYQSEKRDTSSCQIIFKSSIIACYFVALKAIDDHDFDFVSCFSEWCMKDAYPKEVKAFILNWLMLFYVESNQSIRDCLSKEKALDQVSDQ